MHFVLDASIAISWAMQDEKNPIADRMFELVCRNHAAAEVPGIWLYEVRNILIQNERRGRISRDDVDLFLDSLRSYSICQDHLPDWDQIDDLTRRFRLTTYDAAYLALAIRKEIPLATLDTDLQKAAPACGVPLLA